LDLGVGVGWQHEEYDAAGLDFTNRGRLLDHTLEVCQTLWSQTRAQYRSPELSFEGIHMMPQTGGRPTGSDMGSVARQSPEWSGGGSFRREMISVGDAAASATGIARMKDQLVAAAQTRGSLRSWEPPTHAAPDGSIDIARTMARVPELGSPRATDLRIPARGADRP